MPGQGRADAELHRVAGGQHTDAAPAQVADALRQCGQRTRPGQPFTPIGLAGKHGEVALAADQHLGRVDQGSGCGRQAGEPVFADADDRKPGLHQFSGRMSALAAPAAIALPPRGHAK
jgi:hypothetical protein